MYICIYNIYIYIYVERDHVFAYVCYHIYVCIYIYI